MLFGKFVPDCIRSDLRRSKFKIFLGGGMPPDPPSSHACLHMLLSSCYHPVSPPPQLKILYETLKCVQAQVESISTATHGVILYFVRFLLGNYGTDTQ